MSSTFGSLQIGVRGLQAHQLALEVTGQNIANVDTKGYSRQKAILTTTDPYDNPNGAGQVGTGVEVSAIVSLRDRFIDGQIRSANSKKGALKAKQNAYEYMETIFSESSDASISNYIDEFWSSLQKLSGNASSSAYRSSVFESANSLAGTIKETYTQLQKLQSDCDNKVKTLVDQVNSLAGQIADLNKVIRQVTASGQSANDLIDQREGYTQQLAELVNISVQTTSTNEYNITINGASLILGENVYELKAVENANGFSDVVWPSGSKVQITGGQIGGYLEMRDQSIASYMDNLNLFASTLITEFNDAHQKGYTLDGSAGTAFFSGTGASNIEVAITDLNQIAAAASNTGSGDGDNAINLCDVLNSKDYTALGGLSLDQYYTTVVNRLAVEAHTTYSLYDNKESLVDYLTAQQQSIAGVSLDEEAANLIIYENAYNASSRYVSVIDEMLNTLINSTGVVGL